MYAGESWKGDSLVPDIEKMEEMDASELHARRLNAKEVLKPLKKWKLHIPSRIWNSTKYLGERRVRTFILTLDRPERGEEQEILQGKSDESHSSTRLQDESTRDGEEAESDFWTTTGEFINRQHVVRRVELYMPKEESFLIPLKYIDVARTICTSLDVFLEKHFEDYWNVDGERKL